MKLPLVFCLLLAPVLPAGAKSTHAHHLHPAAPDSTPSPAKDKPAATTVAKPDAQHGTGETPPGQNGGVEIKTREGLTVHAQWENVAHQGDKTLDAYIQALADQLPLSKDEQKDIKTYYLDDGAPLSTILNNASLSPFQQTRQVDDLRDTRNGKIEALLRDVDRQQAFLKTEAVYRVALTELAAHGQLVPISPPPRVPEPTATTPAQAEKTPVKP